MNRLPGHIETVQVKGSLSLVTVLVNQSQLTAIVIDTPETAPYLHPGNAVHIIFKETEVIIGKGTEHLNSLRNKMVGPIRSIETGELLSKLVVDTNAGAVTSIITTRSVRQMDLQPGTLVTAMVKTNEMMLSA